MSRRDRWRSAAGKGAALLFVLLFMSAALCLFDHDGDGMNDHGMPQDVCWVVLVVPAVTLTVSGPTLQGLVASLAGTGLPAVPRSLLDPPPRHLSSV